MKKLLKISFLLRGVLILVIMVIVTDLSSCGKNTKEYKEVISAEIETDSKEVINNDIEENVEAEDVEKTLPTAEEIFERMLEANEIFNKMIACQSEYNDKTDRITKELGGSERAYVAIAYPGINSIQDLWEMAEEYYTQEAAESVMPIAECVVEENDKLYVTSPGIGGVPIAEHKVNIKKIDEREYDITVTTYYEEDIFESYSESLKYIYTVNGWVFDSRIPFSINPDVYVYLESNSDSQ